MTFFYNASVILPNDPWTELPSMNTPRKRHLCQKYNLNGMEVVLAVGGFDNNDEPIQSIEVFYMINK